MTRNAILVTYTGQIHPPPHYAACFGSYESSAGKFDSSKALQPNLEVLIHKVYVRFVDNRMPGQFVSY